MYDIILGRSSSDTEKYGKKGTVFIGKQYVQMGQTSSLSNPIYLDVSRAHAMLIVGKRGGGKCLHGETEILLSNFNKINIKKIFDIYSKTGLKINRDDEIDEYILKEELKIKSFDFKNQYFLNKKVTRVFRRKVKEKLINWKFSNYEEENKVNNNNNHNNNSEILCTFEHKLLGIKSIDENNSFGWFNYSLSNLNKFNNNNNYIYEKLLYGNHFSFSEIDFLIGISSNNNYILKNFDGYYELVDFEGYVYDIEVEDTHNFVANGVVVHNSYTMGSIAEGLADMEPETAKNLAFVLLDTMGVYWSMKYPNKKEEDFLKKWGLDAKGLDVQIFVPGGFFDKYKNEGIPVDFPFYIQPKELAIEDWMNAFKLKTDDPVGVGVQRIINKLLDSEKNFDLDDIIELTEKDEKLEMNTKLAVITRFENAKTWGIFSKNASLMKDILIGGKVSVLDFSPYVAMPGGWEVKALALGIFAKKIFVERMLVRKKEEIFDIINKTQVIKNKEIEEDLPMPWLIVDECHEFLPAGDEDAPSKKALMTILREGRQPGVSLVMATQQPAKIHTDAITQSDIVLAHRLTASFDLEALDKVFLSYDSKGSKALFNSMPRTKGCAIIMDDKNERLHTMQIKPRFTWHGGEDPNAIRDVNDEFDFD